MCEGDIAVDIAESPEAIGRLGRAPDTPGLNGWVPDLNTGVSRATIAVDIAERPESMSHPPSQIETGFRVV